MTNKTFTFFFRIYFQKKKSKIIKGNYFRSYIYIVSTSCTNTRNNNVIRNYEVNKQMFLGHFRHTPPPPSLEISHFHPGLLSVLIAPA